MQIKLYKLMIYIQYFFIFLYDLPNYNNFNVVIIYDYY